jgi:O-antigen ligase
VAAGSTYAARFLFQPGDVMTDLSQPAAQSDIRERSHWIEKFTLWHIALLVIASSWMLGGNTPWARTVLACWGSLGILVPLAMFFCNSGRLRHRLRPLRWLWPLALFDTLVVVSACNPSFREIFDGSRILYVEDLKKLRLPSSARPVLSLVTLWFFNAAYLSCFNLTLSISRRKAIRSLLLVLLGNAVLLAVFGTLQKLMGATGLFFGLVKSPQIFFFSSFIYHNHWGTFTVLMTGIAIGLVFYYARRSEARDFWHSPAFGGVVAILLLAASIPLSTSRSCTVLVALLLIAGLLDWTTKVLRGRDASRLPKKGTVIFPFLAITVLAGVAYFLAGDVMKSQAEKTRQQISEMKAEGEYMPRARLYRDSWNMAKEKIWFGWGMASYPTVFFVRNTRAISPIDGLPAYFRDAHSDWLQSVSEVGLVGTALLGLCALVPLMHVKRSAQKRAPTIYLLGGCGVVVLYAWLEFPFGNRAVIIAFWTCFFCAVQYGRLDSHVARQAR